ncbi:MAG: DUF6457 domain-containing protein [Nocardioidaceae bacterium]
MSLTRWTQHLTEALDLELDTDIGAVLDLARDAAHNVERPAAPLTTFLVGYAAALRGGSPGDVAECIRIATDLTETYEEN